MPFLAQFLPATRLAQIIGEARDAALAPEKKETLPGRRPLYASESPFIWKTRFVPVVTIS